MARVTKGALAHLAVAGAELTVRVTPGASAEGIDEGVPLSIRVTASPEGGRANAAVRAVLARALGVPKSRLTLLRGARSRTKVWRIS